MYRIRKNASPTGTAIKRGGRTVKEGLTNRNFRIITNNQRSEKKGKTKVAKTQWCVPQEARKKPSAALEREKPIQITNRRVDKRAKESCTNEKRPSGPPQQSW